MTYHIGLTLILIALTLVAFIREWGAPDVISLTVLCVIVGCGLIPMDKMTEVFRNEAPLTIAALFVIGGALETSGAVDKVGEMLKARLGGSTRGAIFAFTGIAAFFSAWMNNTAIVAILLPVTLGFARSKNVAASKLLLPLSYASILGGCCTLIGTSTNLLVNGALRGYGVAPMSMFELAPVGVPLAIAGILYLGFFGSRMLPDRGSIAGSLEIQYRASTLYHVLVGEESELCGRMLFDTPLFKGHSGVHVLEVRRNGQRMMLPLNAIRIEKFDRFLVALHGRMATTAPAELFAGAGAKILSTVDGIVTELVVRDESSLIGRTMAKADFRQHYNAVVLAVHRNGVNITREIANIPLDIGDTLLVITPAHNLVELKHSRDFVLTDSPVTKIIEDRPKHHAGLAWSAIIAVVLVATLTDVLSGSVPWIPKIPIHYCAMVGALFLLWTKVLTPRDAYASIDWQILLMLYGLLGLGMAMQYTGTAEWLATGLVGITGSMVPPHLLAIASLWTVYLLTLLLTEVLSNNATAVMMIPIVVTLAHKLGVDARPFIIAITVAASAAFALPMGYQTHLMVYGPGGYRFSDFLRAGIPLNIICWVIACTIIPWIWPFHP